MKLPQNINLAKIGVFAFRILVFALAIYALVKGCSPEPQVAEDKNEPLKAENKIIEVSKTEDKIQIDALTKQIQSLKEQLASSKISKAKSKEFLKSLENGEVADYYNNRYRFNDCFTTEKGTEIGDSTAYHSISELIDLDYCKKDYATLSKMYVKLDSNSLHYKSLWEKTEKQKDNNLKMYQNDSTDLSDLRKETNREVKFRLSMHFEYGNTIDFLNPTYKANILIQDKNNNSYSGGVDQNKIIYFGYGRQLFQIKGKKK